MKVNQRFLEMTGYEMAAFSEDEGVLARIWSDPRVYERAMSEFEEGESLRNREMVLRTRDGMLLDCLVSAEPVVILDQSCVLGVIQDITEHKRSEVELMAAIQAVMQDTSWFSQTVIEKLAQIREPHGKPREHAELADLTVREREILGLMCQGLTDPEIAQTLNLSRNTVRNHVASLYGKLDVHRRSAAVIWARQRGIVGDEKPRCARPADQ